MEQLGNARIGEKRLQIRRIDRPGIRLGKLDEVADFIARRELGEAEPVAGLAQAGCFGVYRNRRPEVEARR